MSRMLITALKIFLLLILVAAVAFGAVLLADYRGWSRWIAAAAVAGLFFIVLATLFLRRYYYRRREAKFVRRVVAQDQQAIAAAPIHERQRLVELQERWSTAVATLRASRLRHGGDPLYRLPWYMIFGESGSGKSTAVSHARLKNILTDAGPAKGIASTKNCDWWFFENAIILDTAGRYAVPLADEDRGEWERFLMLLAKYRRKEPLNGLIVTLPADRLLSDDADAMTAYGRSIRLRIDQLMRVLGAKFPVYLLLTKIDQVLGMTALAEILPENLRGQAMGLLNASEKSDPDEFLDRAMAHVSRRLKGLRLRLTARVGKRGGQAVLFPDEFERLASAIRAFVNGAFHENPYQETPFFRGFFISSGRQSGLTRSGVLGSLESFKDRQWRLPDTGLGLFLHDFFDAILPKDRAGYRLLGEYLLWRKTTVRLALAAWLLLLLTVIGLTSFAYVNARQAMAPIYASYNRTPSLGASVADDMVTLGLLRDRIVEMEQRLNRPILSVMGFDQGRRALAGLKQKYTQWFRTFLLNTTDAAMRGKFLSLAAPAREAAMAPYLEYLVWRVETLKAREAGKPLPDATATDAPLQALALAFDGRMPYVNAFFPDMYRSYALWETDLGLLRRERTEMQVWADRVVELEGRDLHWLVAWAEKRIGLAAITLDDFWSGPGQVARAPRVSGAFTVQGKAAIEGLVARLTLNAADQAAFQQRVQDFQAWYAKAFVAAWERFARDFHLGQGKLLARQAWVSTGAAMATLDNPYFNLLTRMEEEFAAIRPILADNELDRLDRQFVFIVHSYTAKKGKATLEARIAEKMKRLEARLEKLDDTLAAADEFGEYMTQLDALVPVTATNSAAYQFAMQNYGKPADAQGSPVVLALDALHKMRARIGQAQRPEELFWRLMEGPLAFVITLTSYEAACAVNELWQSQVVAETAYVPEQQLWNALFGEKGAVGAFVADPVKPFLRRTRDGWMPGAWLGVPFPFRSDFLSFLYQGAVRRQQLQPKYTASVNTVPTNVNPDAKSEPYQTRLTLQCADRQQSLDNFNAPNSLDFVWEPAICDDVSLTIFFRETTVTHTWPGQWGFRDFLRAFRDGREVFVPEAFPRQKEILAGLGIKYIQLNYRLRNAEPILKIEQYPDLKVPDEAAHCWSGLGQGESAIEKRP